MPFQLGILHVSLLDIYVNSYKYRTNFYYNFIFFISNASNTAYPHLRQTDIVPGQIFAELCYFCSESGRIVLLTAEWRHNRAIEFTKMANPVSWKIVSVPHAPPGG